MEKLMEQISKGAFGLVNNVGNTANNESPLDLRIDALEAKVASQEKKISALLDALSNLIAVDLEAESNWKVTLTHAGQRRLDNVFYKSTDRIITAEEQNEEEK